MADFLVTDSRKSVRISDIESVEISENDNTIIVLSTKSQSFFVKLEQHMLIDDASLVVAMAENHGGKVISWDEMVGILRKIDEENNSSEIGDELL